MTTVLDTNDVGAPAMTTGRLEDIDDDTYFSLPSIDQSQLKQYLANPADWAYKRLYGDTKKTDALNFGTAFHALLLDTTEVVSLPEGETFRSGANRQWREDEEALGHIVVSAPEMTLLLRMRDNLRRYPEFYDLIDDGLREQAIEWTDAETGLRLKAKLDLIPRNTDFLVDLKTARSANARDFMRESLDYGYHIQAEFYRAAVSQIDPEALGRTDRYPTGMQFWVFEKTDACDWQPFSISADSPMADCARISIRQALRRIKRDMEMGVHAGLGEGLDAAARWAIDHGYPKTVREITYDDWVLRAAEDIL